MTRVRISIALVAVLAFVAAGVAPAGGTTGPGYQFVIGVRLRNTGVGFTKEHIPRGAVVQFIISNLSSKPRYFLLAGRRTKLLKPSQREIFFLGFDYRGRFPYRSWGPNAKQYRGTFVVT